MRVLAAVGGALALLLGTVLSFGVALAALLGIGLAALVRRRRLTWIGSLAGAVLFAGLAFGGLITVSVSLAPGGLAGFEQSMEQAQQQAQTQPQPPIVRKMQKLFPPNPVAQRQNERMMKSKAWMWGGMAMGLLAGCFFFGVLVGAPTWGCVMLIGYGLRGRWPMQRRAA
jgi:predicted PurR-regulated permease PerM